jgi:hypothetical protein
MSWRKTGHTFHGIIWGQQYWPPVTVTFANLTSLTTSVTIGAKDTNERSVGWDSLDVTLELSAYDGEHTSTDTVKVTCNPNYAGAISR